MSSCIPVLTYHTVNSQGPVTPRVFERHLTILKELEFRSLRAEELNSLLKGETREKERALAITFDDGFLDNWTIASPLLEKYGFCAIFFIITSRVEPTGNGCRPRMGAGESGKTGFTARRVNWDELREIERLGLGDVHSHTHSHRHFFKDLNGCKDGKDLVWLSEDIDRSKREIEKYLGSREVFLCWPGGEYDSRAVECAENFGFRTFFTTKDGVNRVGSGTREIKRLHVTSKGRIPFGLRVLLYSGSLRYRAFKSARRIFG